ncbi:MAG: hypothetical protein ACYSX0_22140, partial [Planctomycetota bacterium]
MTTEQRLAQLERQLRWLKRLGALTIAVGAVVVLGGQGKEKRQVLEANELVLKDTSGAKRIAMNADLDGWPAVGLYDRDGVVRLSLAVAEGGQAVVNLSGGSGEAGLMLVLSGGKQPAILMHGPNHQPGLVLGVLGEGDPILRMTDGGGRQRAKFSLVRGKPTLQF